MIGQAERLLELKRLQEKERNGKELKIVSFSSGKGGTGKTFLSLNTAYTLSQKKKVLFVDLDANLANAHIMLNVIPTATLFNFFNNNVPLDSLINKQGENLHFIFGDSGRNNFPKYSASIINNFFDQLHRIGENYDFIILDIGSGAGDDILNLILKTDLNIIVTTPEPTSVMDAYVIVKLLKLKNYRGKKSIIINKCSGEEEGLSAFNNLNSASKHFLKEENQLLGTVNSDNEVTRSIINQELYIKTNAYTKTAKQISQLSSRLIEIKQLANIHQS